MRDFHFVFDDRRLNESAFDPASYGGTSAGTAIPSLTRPVDRSFDRCSEESYVAYAKCGKNVLERGENVSVECVYSGKEWLEFLGNNARNRVRKVGAPKGSLFR